MNTIPPSPAGRERAELDHALALVVNAHNQLHVWRGQEPERVRAAHQCITSIDAVLVELYHQRRRLMAELRHDSVERAVRVEALLAHLRDEQRVRSEEHRDHRPAANADREDPQTGAPLPPGVEGWAPGRGGDTR